jgi:transglutaminase-like putative cysteine protease
VNALSPPLVLSALVLALAASLHLEWLPPSVSVPAYAVIALRLIAARFGIATTAVLARLAVAIVLGAAVWMTLGSFLGREAGSATLTAMLAAKLFESNSRRDLRVVVTVSLFLAMCGFLFDQGPQQYALASITAVLALAAVALLDALGTAVATASHAAIPWHGAARDALRYSAYAVPFALACFVFFPRLDTPLWGSPGGGSTATTGMSDRMQPGQISSLALDDTPVMRVRFEGAPPPPPERYFRALVFWWFDGEAWTGPNALSGFNQAPSIEFASDAPRYRYEVLLEPNDQRWLYLLDAPLSVSQGGRLTGDFQGRWRERITSPLRYQASSSPRYRMQPELPPDQRLFGFRYTGPRNLNLRARALAAQWREETGGDPQRIAERALALFNREFVYSFEPPLLGRNSIDEFLFDSRTGFCEHFASAFTFLMRAAEVPARVVVGFQGGQFNATGGFLTVRRSDAHAWSEVWLRGRGWVRFDPTAAVAPERIQRDVRQVFGQQTVWETQSWLASLRERFDAAGYWWRQTVIQFNALRQRDLMQSFGVDQARPTQLIAAMLVSAALALGLGAFLLPRRIRRNTDRLLRAWRDLSRRLARLGLARAPAEGPLEYGERVAAQRPDLAEKLADVFQRFAQLRYGMDASPTEIVEFERQVKQLSLPRR